MVAVAEGNTTELSMYNEIILYSEHEFHRFILVFLVASAGLGIHVVQWKRAPGKRLGLFQFILLQTHFLGLLDNPIFKSLRSVTALVATIRAQGSEGISHIIINVDR